MTITCNIERKALSYSNHGKDSACVRKPTGRIRMVRVSHRAFLSQRPGDHISQGLLKRDLVLGDVF